MVATRKIIKMEFGESLQPSGDPPYNRMIPDVLYICFACDKATAESYLCTSCNYYVCDECSVLSDRCECDECERLSDYWGHRTCLKCKGLNIKGSKKINR